MSAADSALWSGRRGNRWSQRYAVGLVDGYSLDINGLWMQMRAGESEDTELLASSYATDPSVRSIDLTGTTFTGPNKRLCWAIEAEDTLTMPVRRIFIEAKVPLSGFGIVSIIFHGFACRPRVVVPTP